MAIMKSGSADAKVHGSYISNPPAEDGGVRDPYGYDGQEGWKVHPQETSCLEARRNIETLRPGV
jgi:hypothetical protein